MAHVLLQRFQTLLSYSDTRVRFFSCDLKKKKKSFLLNLQGKKGRGQDILGLHLQSRAEAAAAKILPAKVFPAQKGSGQKESTWENNWKWDNWLGSETCYLGVGSKLPARRKSQCLCSWVPTLRNCIPCVETPVIFNPTGDCREASTFSLKYHPV